MRGRCDSAGNTDSRGESVWMDGKGWRSRGSLVEYDAGTTVGGEWVDCV